MKKNNGFTLIDLVMILFVFAIALIFIVVLFSKKEKIRNHNNPVQQSQTQQENKEVQVEGVSTITSGIGPTITSAILSLDVIATFILSANCADVCSKQILINQKNQER